MVHFWVKSRVEEYDWNTRAGADVMSKRHDK
jgi:hypothetical protein